MRAIVIDGKKKVRGPISLAAITNSYRYGGGFKINPSARFDDGILNLCIAQPIVGSLVIFSPGITLPGIFLFENCKI